ncbi:uncharacterized protein LOC143055345 [Mytilus galloprovincialis]|uniref:Syndecan n=3 Tax=Mytilus TaxID=6548 RepID=A0A8B6CA80_MYTGA|nr:syndecan 2 [Mytilus galloprovincialis]
MKLHSSLWITIFGLFLFVSISNSEQFPGTSWGTEKKTYIDIDTAHNDFLEDSGSGHESTTKDDTTDDEDLIDFGSGSGDGSGVGKIDLITTKAPTTIKMTACQQLRSSTKTFSSDFYIPECTITGEYEKRQCEGKVGSKKCWCVDSKGREIPGSQMTEPEVPDCHEGKNLKPCVFELLKTSSGLLGARQARCTFNGEYEKVQCHVRECWCVDKNGIERMGTRVSMTTWQKSLACEETIKGTMAPPLLEMTKAPETPFPYNPETTKKVIDDKPIYNHGDKSDETDTDDRTPTSVDVNIGGGKFDTESEDNTNIDKSENIRPDRPEAQKTTFLQIMASPGILAAVIGGSVVGLLCAILLVMFIIYRMRKKDEGSYPLEEQRYTNYSYMKAPEKEFYA